VEKMLTAFVNTPVNPATMVNAIDSPNASILIFYPAHCIKNSHDPYCEKKIIIYLWMVLCNKDRSEQSGKPAPSQYFFFINKND
jgi:hypothetical protein